MPKPPQSTRNSVVLPVQRKDVSSALLRLRSAVATGEHEDAGLTGMTRSLDRRLLALNLEPLGASSYQKVA